MPAKFSIAAVSMALETLNFYEKASFVGPVFSDSIFVLGVCLRATEKGCGLQHYMLFFGSRIGRKNIGCLHFL